MLEDNNKLTADNKRLQKENANLQIKLRIMEAEVSDILKKPE